MSATATMAGVRNPSEPFLRDVTPYTIEDGLKEIRRRQRNAVMVGGVGLVATALWLAPVTVLVAGRIVVPVARSVQKAKWKLEEARKAQRPGSIEHPRRDLSGAFLQRMARYNIGNGLDTIQRCETNIDRNGALALVCIAVAAGSAAVLATPALTLAAGLFYGALCVLSAGKAITSAFSAAKSNKEARHTRWKIKEAREAQNILRPS